MSKRALLAGLASVAILPLQATQVLALGGSKTVRRTKSISIPAVNIAEFVLREVFCMNVP